VRNYLMAIEIEVDPAIGFTAGFAAKDIAVERSVGEFGFAWDLIG
jgi:hypothetical protein